MNSLWGNFDGANDFKIPKAILEEQALYIAKMTKNKLYCEVLEEQSIDDYYEEDYFRFKLVIKSEFLRNYEFTVLTIKHKILQYPLNILIPEEIVSDIKKEKDVGQLWNGNGGFEHHLTASDDQEFIKLLRLILSSENLMRIVKTLYQMAK
ncbi:hypothetical protein [Lysinibacillus fusiformis]|uniref:hypothetical protein n=1 Tax=Lysinibacillus fusiformis TaxID=28031 RepID=UPI003558E803